MTLVQIGRLLVLNSTHITTSTTVKNKRYFFEPNSKYYVLIIIQFSNTHTHTRHVHTYIHTKRTQNME